MWTRRKNYLAKSVVAMLVGGALMAIFVPVLSAIYSREIPDQGVRPLVIIATQGGTADYRMHTRSAVGVDGQYRIAFYIDTDKPEPVVPESRFWVDFEIVVAGTEVAGNVTCGGGVQVPSIPYSALGVGSKYVYDIDQASTRGSATNYRSGEATPDRTPATSGPPSQAPATEQTSDSDIEFARFTGRLPTYFAEEKVPSRRIVGEDKTVWVEECVIDRDLVWMGSLADRDPTEMSSATLMPPQINYTSIGDTTDHQTDFDGRIWIERGEGASLAESFPTPTTSSSGWSLWYQKFWQGELGSRGNYMYTDQPTMLFTNRNSARSEQTLLIFGGMALGLALSLFVRGLSDLADAVVKDPPTAGEEVDRAPQKGEASET